jgi:hypothetical protein
MEKELKKLQEHLDKATTSFTKYLKTIIANKDYKFWEEEEWERIKGLYITYSSGTFEILCVSWDEDMEECDEQEETSFFLESYNKSQKRAENANFLPDDLNEILPNSEFEEIFEHWITKCWTKAKGKSLLLGFTSWMDSAYYTSMDSGEKGDHIFVMDLLNPNAIEEQETDKSGFTKITNRASKIAIKNPKGEIISEYIYDFVSEFKDGLCLIAINDKYGFINECGELVIPMVYDYSPFYFMYHGHFSDGVTCMFKDSKWGYIDNKNNAVIPFMYDAAGNFNNGLANVQLGEKWGYINIKNETMLPFIYSDFTYEFMGDFAQVNLNGEEGFIDRKGNFRTDKPEGFGEENE